MIDVPRGACLVVFVSCRAAGDDEEYDTFAGQMAELVERQPGYLGSVSVRDPHTLMGITAASFASEQHALAWKNVVEHRRAQQAGRDRLYADYQVIVTQVMRSYRR